jgi:hypothetical protein
MEKESRMLNKIVNEYMKSQWVNCRRDIGFYAAREELLGGGKIRFCEPGTTTPKAVFSDTGLTISHHNPVMADVCGDFGEMHLDGDYSLTVEDKNGEYIAIHTTRSGFDIYA